ncbi:MAG: hypothetical protein E6940_02945 [Clostridium septicum]|uniref:hypothetical protein n=1 Tax=Clostridium septicum TaxID=1504 RepID=UPI002586D91C|nr:hypothetical protein [Clostridium septicum]MDU1313002.1 hypothetical protein [Clostridium septicum]
MKVLKYFIFPFFICLILLFFYNYSPIKTDIIYTKEITPHNYTSNAKLTEISKLKLIDKSEELLTTLFSNEFKISDYVPEVSFYKISNNNIADISFREKENPSLNYMVSFNIQTSYPYHIDYYNFKDIDYEDTQILSSDELKSSALDYFSKIPINNKDSVKFSHFYINDTYTAYFKDYSSETVISITLNKFTGKLISYYLN